VKFRETEPLASWIEVMAFVLVVVGGRMDDARLRKLETVQMIPRI
jgi:hypothetical protein